MKHEEIIEKLKALSIQCYEPEQKALTYAIKYLEKSPYSDSLLQEAKEKYKNNPVVTWNHLKGNYQIISKTIKIDGGCVVAKVVDNIQDYFCLYNVDGKWAEIVDYVKKEPQPLKIEVGAEYQTRDGREVRIYATDGEGDFPVHGAMIEDDEWSAETWSIQGKWLAPHFYKDHNNDLILKPKKPLEFTEWYDEIYDGNSLAWDVLSEHEINEHINKYTEYLNDFEFKQELKAI